MATNALDRIRSAASGALVIGTAVAARAARTARPLIGKAFGAIRSRVSDSATSPVGTSPVTVTPAPPPPAEPAAAAPAKASAAEGGAKAAPTPAAVAKNIPPHPPRPESEKKPARKPVKKAAPGAKLPPRRRPAGS